MYICKEVADDFWETDIIKGFNGTGGGGGGPSIIPVTLPPATEALAGEFEWNTASVIKSIIFTAITLCTIGGNGMVLLAMILRRSSLKSSTHYFIASLSLADFLVGILVMPFLAVLSVSGKWYFGRGYCTAFHCIHYFLCSASILSITAICVERYIGVQYPLQHFKFMNVQRVAKCCAVVWTIAFILSVPPLFIWAEPFTKDYDCPVNFQVGHVVTVMVFMFYIPCTIMLSFYLKIYCIASSHLQAISERRKKTHGINMSATDSGIHGKKGKSTGSTGVTDSAISGNSCSIGPETSSGATSESWEMVDEKKVKDLQTKESNELKANRKQQTSLSKKLFLVVGAFFICYFPFFTTFMVAAINPDLVPLQLFIALGWIRYFNSCLNPIIYASSLKPFRDAFRDILSFLPWVRK